MEKRLGFVRAKDAAHGLARYNEECADAIGEKIKELLAEQAQLRLKAARCMEDEHKADSNIVNIDKAHEESEADFDALFARWAIRTSGDTALMTAAQYVNERAQALADKVKVYDRAQQAAAINQIEKLCTLVCLHDSREAGLHLFNVRALNSDLEDYQGELHQLNEQRAKAQMKLRSKEVAAMKPRIEELTQLIESVKDDLRVQMAKDDEINARWMTSRAELEEIRKTQQRAAAVPVSAPAPAAASKTDDPPPAYYAVIPVEFPGMRTEVDSPQAFRDYLRDLTPKMLTDSKEGGARTDDVVVPVLD